MSKTHQFKELPRLMQAALANLVLFYSEKEWSHERICVEGVEGNGGVQGVFLQIEVYDLRLPDRPMPEHLQRLLFGEATDDEAPESGNGREEIVAPARLSEGAGNHEKASSVFRVAEARGSDESPVAESSMPS